MCQLIPAAVFSQPPSSPVGAAKTLGPEGRQDLAVQALAGTAPITDLAEQAHVSRKFVYQQKSRAAAALEDAFAPRPDDDNVLFHLPVTKQWLRQLTLGLVLIGHCPLRGVVELCRDLLDFDISLGSVHSIVQSAVASARRSNEQQELSGVRVGAHDEIFQHRQPVLVGVDAWSSYCYLLSLEDHRDGDTWGVRLLELQQRGLQPDTFIADAGRGLRAGQANAFPDVPCRSDVFHALKEVQDVATSLENQAYQAIAACTALEHKIAARQHRGLPTDHSSIRRRDNAVQKQTAAVALAEQIACLSRWLRHDVLALAGPCHADRCELYDFIRIELQARVDRAPHLLQPLVTYLTNQRNDLLDFAAQLDRDFDELAQAFDVAPALVRELFAAHTLDLDHPLRGRREAKLHDLLGERYFLLSQAVAAIARWTVRASSVVENLNSRLRDYFFLRHTLGNDYLALLQFFLNHRRFVRSHHPDRVNHSPTELLTGREHPHWLALLGYQPFSRT